VPRSESTSVLNSVRSIWVSSAQSVYSSSNPLIAPGLEAWDISLQRAFRLGDRFGFEFRASFFNAFNHPNFAEPAPGPANNTFITASADDGSFDSHFGVGGPRNIQFQGKITW